MPDTTTAFKSPLHEMTQTTATCLWNDSCVTSGARIRDRARRGRRHLQPGDRRRRAQARDARSGRIASRSSSETLPTATEHEIGWRLVDEMTVKGAALLKPIFDAQNGRNGRLSVQTDPRFYRDTGGDSPPGRPLRGSRAEHHREDPGHGGRHPGDRRGDLSRRSASTPRSASRCRSASRSPRRSSAACDAANRKARASRRWGRSARSWWAGWTTG